ncbi:hypothetical protein O5833_26970, partial [Escherichia coli]|nr:hypothetical protein [Escherichia coli]
RKTAKAMRNHSIATGVLQIRSLMREFGASKKAITSDYQHPMFTGLPGGRKTGHSRSSKRNG